MAEREPIFNAPAIVVWTLGVLALVHIGLQLLSPAAWSDAIELLAVIPSRYTAPADLLPGGRLAGITSLVTHQFVHGDLTHIGFNAAWLLAFGSAVASRIGTLRFIVFALLCGVAGALTFIGVHFGESTIMVGASGALAGLMGGAFRFLFSAFDDRGPGAFRGDQTRIRRMSLGELVRDRRAQFAIGIWIGLNAVTAYLAPLLTSAGGIAWEAHLGGFLFGLLAFGRFDVVQPVPEASRPTLH